MRAPIALQWGLIAAGVVAAAFLLRQTASPERDPGVAAPASASASADEPADEAPAVARAPTPLPPLGGSPVVERAPVVAIPPTPATPNAKVDALEQRIRDLEAQIRQLAPARVATSATHGGAAEAGDDGPRPPPSRVVFDTPDGPVHYVPGPPYPYHNGKRAPPAPREEWPENCVTCETPDDESPGTGATGGP